MSRYRNKLVYDANTGEVRDDRKFMSMMEDFWLPRREGGRGTEITTLPGGQNLGELSDIEYFQKKLYRALAVPESRIAGSGDGFNLGRSSEILRDELKFAKFVGRLRKRFAYMFNDMLRTQLILKNIVSPEDWEIMEDHIQYDFLYDNQFSELKEAELLQNRLGILATVEPYIGKYYSTEYVRKRILRQTDSEIIEIDGQIEDEIKTGCKNVPTIWYNDENGKKHRHYVDIFIPSQNRCIEIKSTWTAKKKQDSIYLKQNAAKELGYKYEIWVYDGKGNRVKEYL